jgi:hypothetical protein
LRNYLELFESGLGSTSTSQHPCIARLQSIRAVPRRHICDSIFIPSLPLRKRDGFRDFPRRDLIPKQQAQMLRLTAAMKQAQAVDNTAMTYHTCNILVSRSMVSALEWICHDSQHIDRN